MLSKFVLATVLLSGSAQAQKAESPPVKAGDHWQFAVYYSAPSAKPNRIWAITAVTPEGIAGTENGEPLLLTSDMNVLESPRQKDSNPKALSFPLEVGKRWHFASDWVFKAKGSTGRSVTDVEVTGYEQVTVPAGRFDAFRLVAKGRLSGTSPINSVYNAETTAIYWYAPAARVIVKSVSHNPYLGTSTVDLVAFELQP